MGLFKQKIGYFFILHPTAPSIHSLYVHRLFIWNVFLPNPTTPAVLKSYFHNLIFTYLPAAILKVRGNNQKFNFLNAIKLLLTFICQHNKKKMSQKINK